MESKDPGPVAVGVVRGGGVKNAGPKADASETIHTATARKVAVLMTMVRVETAKESGSVIESNRRAMTSATLATCHTS